MTDPIQSVAIAAGLGWASGIRLYGVLFILGLLGSLDMMTLPENLQILTHPVVLWTSGFLFFVEFFADKIPLVDSLWDSVHTFIPIPAGALLAAASVGNIDTGWTLAAGLLGGTLAGGSHFTKAGTRALINISPGTVQQLGRIDERRSPGTCWPLGSVSAPSDVFGRAHASGAVGSLADAEAVARYQTPRDQAR